MALSRFTFLCEFRGGTYVSQAVANDVREAIGEWCAEIAVKMPVPHHSAALARAFEANNSGPALLDGLENVWCESAECDGDLALLHVVKTQVNSSSSNIFG